MLLSAQNIDFSYTKNQSIFKDVNFGIETGTIVSIVGLNGEGKSTLLKCLAGKLPVTKGEIYFKGEKLPNPRKLLISGHPEISLVTQRFELDMFFNVRENISNQLHRLSKKERADFVEELLDIFELKQIENQQSREISGGEQQRLSMACAIAKEPSCLLLDEPFVHLDVSISRKIGLYIRKLTELKKISVIITTHSGAEALEWSDWIYILKKGKISKKYSPENAYFKPESLEEGQFFGELNSIYVDGQQKLFRPTEFELNFNPNKIELELDWLEARFRGFYYANYFKVLNSNKTIVLYSDKELSQVNKIYVL